MSLLIAFVLGGVLGYTSHIRASWPRRVEGIIEGIAVVSAANWLFYNAYIWWWLSLILAVMVYAVYLMTLQYLLRKKLEIV